jgi:TolB protein
MTSNQKRWLWIGSLGLLVVCLMGLGGLWLVNWSPRPVQPTHPPLVFPTRISETAQVPEMPVSTLSASVAPVVTGKIVYVCQIFKLQTQDQICLINADGSGQRRLTTTDTARHFYPSFAPDGKSVLFSANLDGNFKIYEQKLTGELAKLGETVGIAPEVSPDNRWVAYTQSDGQKDFIWLMARDGSDPRPLVAGWDPTWAPDASRVLFATTVNGKPQLASVNLDGSDLRQLTELPDLRGRSDWSPDGSLIVTYSGKPWLRELFLMNADGSGLRQLTQPGGNSQGPSFSPDGQQVAFTAYFNAYNKPNGCEIYRINLDGSGLTRLTNNDYCDWQPRWGP